MSNLHIGLISDIHANLHALQAVIAHAHQQNVSQIWNCGDSIGYGAYPNEVLNIVRSEDFVNIRGNYDTKVLKIPKKKSTWQNSKSPIKWFAINWAYENLSEENRLFLAQLPEEVKLEISNMKVLILHGSPASTEEPLNPSTSFERFEFLANMVNADIIICGHSHQAFIKHIGDKIFLNPGSVGRQDDGDPRASFAILKFQGHSVSFDPYRIPYDYLEAAGSIRRYNLPEQFAEIILTGEGFREL